MNRTIPLALIWCVSVFVSCSIGKGQGRQEGLIYAPNPARTRNALKENLAAAFTPGTFVVTVIDTEAKRSDVIKKIVDALEKTGIAKSDAPADQNWLDRRITARLRIQQDAPSEKITALIKALQYVGVMKLSLAKPTTDGKNLLFLVANDPQRSEDIQRIDRAARHAAKENELSLDVISTIPVIADDNAIDAKAAESQQKTTPSPYANPEDITFPDPEAPSMPINKGKYLPEISDPESSKIHPDTLRVQIEQLKKQYEGNDKRANELVKSLSQTPDDSKKAELKSTMMRAFRSRQELLQAELLLMQDRLNQAQANLKQRNQIRNQIVERRVQELLNPQLDWEATQAFDPQQESERPNQSSHVIPKPTELEGVWHQVAYSDGEGDSHEKHVYNKTYTGDRSALIWSTGRTESRIEVDPETKTVKHFNEDRGSYSLDHYELQGDRLIIRESGFVEGDRITVYERGYVPFENVAPTATKPDAP